MVSYNKHKMSLILFMSVDATAETTDAKCSKVNGAPIHNVRAINYISFDAIAENLVEPWLTMHTAVFFLL